ncbi:D-serine ammonia-lyase [Aliamphritea hakodatensis]|uniref:D-serine ammonia-lyase n=1 Tax=Aliamphritea hakodatensis TaxID=2895352 RepID=UPI0022FD66C6|nr:D-serine ammonia-lyase [Aliamphritea hakodatensis]
MHPSADTAGQIRQGSPFLWVNPHRQASFDAGLPLGIDDIRNADNRLRRFAPLLTQLFPELQEAGGLIESALQPVAALQANVYPELPGQLFIKGDHALPVAGSVKARGGIYEVLCHSETLALEHGILSDTDDDYLKLLSAAAKNLFSQYEVAVSSTGNLGLSIGIISAALGFKATVHMSVEAKEWKKTRLRKRGVKVVEHKDDYSAAVAAGRAESDADPNSYFVDDENSQQLFTGYAVAALRLQQQLKDADISVGAEHPLFVYLPCGVGGAPGGIAYGLRLILGPHVHCFFAEPVEAPCVLVGLQAKEHTEIQSVYDFGLKVATEADGLAVSKASPWVCEMMHTLLDGVFTVGDDRLFEYLYQLQQHEGISIEPSAAAGFTGPDMLTSTPAGQAYLNTLQLSDKLDNSTHLLWTTGGLFVPQEEMENFSAKGKQLLSA